uniref:Putative outcast ele5 orf1-h 1e-40-j 4 n=1 Tax=Amblyomma cajennense TaxID=34607 RepID=A0A023FRN3_AMBCJ
MYADDICIWASSVTRLQVRARLQRAASITSSYLQKQGLSVSPEKCALVAFTRKCMTPYPVRIDGQVISYSKFHRFLGILIDRNLSWSPHCTLLKKKLTSIAHLLRFLGGKSWGSSVQSMLKLYRALFVGCLRYSTPVLSNTCKTNMRALQTVQGQALRTCLGLPRSASTLGSIALAKDHPISTYIVLDCLRMHIRHISRIPQHHLASLPLQRPHSAFAKVIMTQQSSIPQQFTPAALPPSPLWCMRLPCVRLAILGIAKKSNLSTPAIKQLTLSMLHFEYWDRTHVYTDGSVTSTSSACAVVVPARQTQIHQQISHRTTSTGAELAALLVAVQYISQQSPQKWAVFCDSKLPYNVFNLP